MPLQHLYVEDLSAGMTFTAGPVQIGEADIIGFAREFDPQDFHLDPTKAACGPFGGIVASGWHTTGVVMRLYVDHYLSHVANLGSPGVEDIRWQNPLRPGDTLRIRVTILEARPSRSKPDRGIIRVHVEAINQIGNLVLSMIVVSFMGRRQEYSVTPS